MEEINIDKKFIQCEAENILGRKLNIREYEEVYETILESISEFIQDSIYKVIDFNELLERNKDAQNILPYYKVYHRNENAYKPEFKLSGAFKTEEDAREYIHHDIITEFDEWRLALVDENNTEQDIYKIHC